MDEEVTMSEVEALLKRIEAEFLAAKRALHDPAIVAPHAFIQKRMENMSIVHDELQRMIPGEQAIALVLQAMENAGRDGEAAPGERR